MLVLPEHYYMDTGTYSISLKMLQENGCSDSVMKTDLVKVVPKPLANFIANLLTTNLLSSDIAFTNKSTSPNAVIVANHWLFGDGTASGETHPAHHYSLPGAFDVKLIVENSFGCFDTMVKTSYIRVDNIFRVYLPDVITVNGDGLNEELVPVGVGFDYYEMEIYNRSGGMVFKTTMGNNKFKGADMSNQPLSQGVYVCLLNVRSTDGEWKKIKTNITILR